MSVEMIRKALEQAEAGNDLASPLLVRSPTGLPRSVLTCAGARSTTVNIGFRRIVCLSERCSYGVQTFNDYTFHLDGSRHSIAYVPIVHCYQGIASNIDGSAVPSGGKMGA